MYLSYSNNLLIWTILTLLTNLIEENWMRRISIAIIVLAVSLSASIINIPADYPTIQMGVDSSLAGDTILVAPGLYIENVVLDSSITLGSFFLTTGDTSFISQTIIDGDSTGTVISTDGDEEPLMIGIFGLTIRNGSRSPARSAGGIYLYSSLECTLDHLIVQGNHDRGIAFRSNGAISNSTIRGNIGDGTSQSGGGITIEGLEVLVVNCEILDNIAGNEAYPGEAWGAGIAVFDPFPSYSTDISISRCLIKGNRTYGQGGGILVAASALVRVINSIITDNHAIPPFGGGLHYFSENLRIINSIIWNNSLPNISVWSQASHADYPIFFYNSIIEGGVESIVNTDPNSWVTIGSYSNCFDADPLFLNAEAGDYSVMDSSPAIDAGTALVTWGDTIYYTPESDYEGFAPDIGLSETSQSLLHEPSNLEVIDVPGDQGGYIYLNWNRSFDDSEWLGNISMYSIWQRIPQSNLGRKVNSNTADLVTDSYKVLRDDVWLNVATIPALQHETYTALLETFADSSESGINMTHLLITAHTTDPLIYYESQIDSGYSVNNEAVSISDNYDVTPKLLYLNQNYPNPFNPTTTIQYGLPEDASVSLTVYDIQGNEIITIDSGLRSAGWYHYTWNGLNDKGQPVSTGLYLARLKAGSYSKVIKMAYLK